jgi:hypothetical protein
MYPEVHTLASANLRWSGVEAQGSPNSTKAHRNLLESSHQDGRLDHYGTLEGGHRTRTSLGQSPQLNWRLLRIALRHHKAWKDPYNLIGGPQVTTTEAPQSLGRSPQLN